MFRQLRPTVGALFGRFRPSRPQSVLSGRPAGWIKIENQSQGSQAWIHGRDPDDSQRQIQGYTSQTSVNVGGSITFHVTTNPAQEFTVEIYRIGWYGGEGSRHMITSPSLTGITQPAPVLNGVNGLVSCDWAASWTLEVPADWVSGLYMASFVAGDWKSATPFVVRDDSSDAKLCVVLPFTTYQAYNQWPWDGRVGKSLYYGFPPCAEGDEPTLKDDPATRAQKVSFDRPYALSGIPSQAEYDIRFIQWLEQEGHDATYCTSLDLHHGLIDPTRHAGLIFGGHDEYWSRSMRDVAEAAVAHGTSLAFLSANAVYWHIRFEPSPTGEPDRVVACYKTDPDTEAKPGQATTKWRNPSPGPRKSEQALLGVQYKSVIPDGQELPLVITNSHHWMWAGSGARNGDAVERLLAVEVDNVDPRYPSPKGKQTLLAESPYTMANGTPTVQHTSIYEAPSGALVFVAGTFHWPFGLNHDDYRDQRIQVATRNLLRRILADSGDEAMSEDRDRLAAPVPQHPTREEVWQDRSAPNEFPSALIAGAASGISFFSAAFFGRNDVIYLDEAGVKEIVLVDTNGPYLAAMAEIFPAVTETYAEDAFAVARKLAADGRVFEVVVCDPFTNDGWPILADHFDTFSALAGRAWVTGITIALLEEAGITPTLEGVQAWLDASGHHDWDAVWFEDRNPSTHLMWLGLRRKTAVA